MIVIVNYILLAWITQGTTTVCNLKVDMALLLQPDKKISRLGLDVLLVKVQVIYQTLCFL